MGQITSTIPAKRQQSIMEYLQENHSITIREAAILCKVSEATARRDLDDLSAQGLLSRTHGGAVLEKGTSLEMVHAEKMKVMIPEKTKIAKEAVKLVEDGSSVYLDSGTTTLLLANLLLPFQNLTVITHSLDIAYHTKLDSSSTLIITGGTRRDNYGVLVGSIAEEMVNKLRVDISFIGADAVMPDSGIYNSNFLEVGIKRSSIHCGETRVLLADHTKFKQKALTKVCGIEEFDVIITDKGLDEKTAEMIQKTQVKLIYA